MTMHARNWTVVGFLSVIFLVDVIITVINYHAAILALRKK